MPGADSAGRERGEAVESDGVAADPFGLKALLSPGIDPAFWVPERIGVMSAWWAHVPFAFWLTTMARPRVLVELGTHNGASYAAFCEAVLRGKLGTRCYAVDTWAGDEHAGAYGEQVYNDLREFHDKRYVAFSELVRSTFDEALPFFLDGSVDLLHIDGYHTYEAVKHDFDSWRPKLSDRAVVLFHDTNVRKGDFGVYRFFAELSQQFPTFEFQHGFGLGVAAVGPDAPAAVKQLCGLTSEAEIGTVRERFAHLGARWFAISQDALALQNAHQWLAEADRQLGEAQQRAIDAEARLRSEQEAGRARAKEVEAARQQAAEARRDADAARQEAREALRRAEERAQEAAAALQRALDAEQELAWRRSEMGQPGRGAATHFVRDFGYRLRGRKPPAG